MLWCSSGCWSGSSRVRENYLDEFNQADLYVGLFWKDYGEYTVDEFEYSP